MAANFTQNNTQSGGAFAPREYTPAAPLLVFLSARYEGEGWACLGSIDGDPSIKKGTPGYSPMVQEWFAWPRQAEAMAARYLELAERGFNLYLGQCLFSERRRAYSTALPSRWLWGDDAPLDAKCTELVQSSEKSHQAWLKLDTLLPAKERGELQRRWRVKLNGDTCSANAVGMVRAPVGYNTKRHGRFPVRVVGGSGSRYKLEDVDAKLPQVKHADRSAVGSTLGDWSNLPSGAGLAKSARFKRACQNRPQLKTIIIDGERVALPGKEGSDDSGSIQIAVFVNNLLNLYKPYPEAEIRALALHYRETLRPGVDLAPIQADVDRLLVNYRPANYNPQATRYIPGVSGEINVCTHQEAKRRGRPAGKSADHRAQLLQLLQGTQADSFGRVPVDTAKLAENLRITRRRVLQLLGDLAKSGEIKSFTPGSRWRGAFVLLSETSGREEAAIDASQNQVKLNQREIAPVESLDSRVESGKSANATPAPLEKTRDHVPGVYSPVREGISLDVALGELLDTLPRERPNTKTGELQRWLVTLPRLLDAMHEQYGSRWNETAIRFAYKRVRKARKRAEWEQLHAMPRSELEKRLNSTTRTTRNYQKRAEQAESAGMREYFEREAKKRQGMLARYQYELGQRPEVVETEQQLLELVEVDRAKRAPHERTRRAVVVSKPVPQPTAQAWSLIARLQQKAEDARV